MDFSIKRIMPHIYHLDFDTQYELAMHFLRVQEYYESPKFHKQIFTLVDYMDWYAKTHGKGAFTYAKDWTGFNVPSWALLGVYKGSTDIPDYNRYDEFMSGLVKKVAYLESEVRYHQRKIHPFYFIGTFAGGGVNKHGEKDDILAHEIAHALYTVNTDYRGEVDLLLEAWRSKFGHAANELKEAREVLAETGYHSSTILDEIHAYCATGLCEKLEGVICEEDMEPFQRLFKRYKKKCAQ